MPSGTASTPKLSPHRHRGDYWDMKDGKLVRFFKLATAALTGTRADDVATHRRFTP